MAAQNITHHHRRVGGAVIAVWPLEIRPDARPSGPSVNSYIVEPIRVIFT